MFEAVRLWPSRTVPILSLEAFDNGLVGNTCVQLSFLLKTGGTCFLSRVNVGDDSVDEDGPLMTFILSVMIRGSGGSLRLTCGILNGQQIELAGRVPGYATLGSGGFDRDLKHLNTIPHREKRIAAKLYEPV
jgi:hypothetical protein